MANGSSHAVSHPNHSPINSSYWSLSSTNRLRDDWQNNQDDGYETVAVDVDEILRFVSEHEFTELVRSNVIELRRLEERAAGQQQHPSSTRSRTGACLTTALL
ncbi:hypothetical protein ADUPG1_013561 [Aduncisulcus paluster]|uniref:Uncharacterized protein n=1 Tax=Aduncisulcus paluster TaxID=2918883 RepID=A0ABQ5K3C5_9EUKA|nr:hypothetical protein ADUPG1_013561 [Aduncisulcus paluster]